MIFEIYIGITWDNKIDPRNVDEKGKARNYWPNAPAHWIEKSLDAAFAKCQKHVKAFTFDGGLVIVEFDGKIRKPRYRMRPKVTVELEIL